MFPYTNGLGDLIMATGKNHALVLAFQPPNNARAVESSVRQLAGTVCTCLLNGIGWQWQIYHRLVLPVESLLHDMLRKCK